METFPNEVKRAERKQANFFQTIGNVSKRKKASVSAAAVWDVAGQNAAAATELHSGGGYGSAGRMCVKNASCGERIDFRQGEQKGGRDDSLHRRDTRRYDRFKKRAVFAV